MKIKELQKTVNVAWSPEQIHDIYLAAGTAAQQLDTSPNTVSTLEIYSTNLLDPSYDLELKGTQQSQYRFQKILWSPTGINNQTHSNGLIVGGCEGGHIQIYNASKLLKNSNNDDNGDCNALIAHQNKHTGTVRGLDFNPFQSNLLASVASESEIFIWDLNNITTPMSPGTKTQPLEDIQNVSWNRQVQHILATVFSLKCVIWDLRKNEQIIKLTDQQNHVRWRAIQWHPNIATQLWLASEDDQSPFVQLWDLRYATTPAKQMKIHQRGILGLTWCPKDSDLMVSCGKDNKIYCWNPNTDKPEGEILSEIATTIQWYSDVQWCPRNPAIIASSSFDGYVSLYSIYGGQQKQIQTSNKIADSFPGMEQQIPPTSLLSQQTANIQQYSDLKKAPKWMKRSAGVSFGFGGRLLMFNNKNPTTKIINICQVTTEPNLIQRSNELEKAIDNGNFIEYCKYKADQQNDQHGRYLWYFIKANFEDNPKAEMLNLLGYNKEDIANKFDKYLKNDNNNTTTTTTNQVDNLTKQMSVLSHSDSSEVEGDQSTDDSTDLSTGDNNALFDSIAAENKTIENELLTTERKNTAPFKIPTGDNNESIICQAILTGNIDAAAEICMEFNCPTEALIIASTTSNIELLRKIQKRYLYKKNTELSNIINALITNDWFDITTRCTIDSWKEALVTALTHNEDQIAYLCDKLGERLQNELSRDPLLAKNSLLCYICAGNIEKLINSWLLINKNNDGIYDNKLNTNEIQDLIEIVMLLKKSLEIRGYNLQPTGKFAEFMAHYAGLLAAQGALNSALSYLGPSEDPNLEELRERLFYALGHKRQQTYSLRGNISQGYQQQQQQQQQQTVNSYGKQTVTTTITNRYGQQRTNSFSSITNQTSTNYIGGNGGTIQNTFNTPPIPGVAQQWNTNPVQSPPQSWNTNVLQQPSSAITTSLHNYDSQQNSSLSTLPPPPPMLIQSQQQQQQQQQQPLSKPPIGAPPITTNDNLNRPQRPSSVGSQGTSSLSRAKYVLDPSVTSGPSYGQTMGVYNPPQQFNTSYGSGSTVSSATLYQPSQSSTSNNFQPFTPAPIASTANLITTNSSGYLSGIPPIETTQQAIPSPPQSSSFASTGGIGGGIIQRNPTPPPGWNDPPVLKSRQQVFYTQKNEMSAEHAGTRKWRQIINNNNNNNQTSNFEYLTTQLPLLVPQTTILQSSFTNTNTNDNNNLINTSSSSSNYSSTFMFQQQQQQQQTKVETAPLNPITHPIFGVDPNQGQNGYADQNFGYSNSQYQNQGIPLPPPASAQQNIIPPPSSSGIPPSSYNSHENSNKIYNPMNFQTQAIQGQQQQSSTLSPPPPSSSNTQFYQPQHIEPAAPSPEPIIKEKPPLPEEFIYMQTVFDELKNQCQNVAQDPRTKRKFTDVTKRLEALYDSLRANKLSQNTISLLNQIVQLIQIGDYQNAMNIYMQIVSGPDFSQTANFMPGIKVLIQSANELQVCLR